MTMADDDRYLKRALALAARGRWRTSPNPMVSAVLAGAGGAWGSWLYGGLAHAKGPQSSGPRFVELAGTFWIALWLPFFAVTLIGPAWGTGHHAEQLVASVVVAFGLVLGTALWSYGCSFRRPSAAAG